MLWADQLNSPRFDQRRAKTNFIGAAAVGVQDAAQKGRHLRGAGRFAGQCTAPRWIKTFSAAREQERRIGAFCNLKRDERYSPTGDDNF